MTALIKNTSVQSVDDLYRQFARLAKSYSKADNPLTGLTTLIPARARHFVVVPSEDSAMALDIMRVLKQRRKLHTRIVEADEVRYSPYARSGKLLVAYA